MSTHTQGPWEIETDHDEGDDVVLIHGAADAPGLVPIATVFTVDAFPCTDDEDRESLRAEYEANARLIAAAPDLLESLLALIAANEDARAAEDNWIRSGHDDAAGMDLEDAQASVIIRENEACAAIAKARPS